MIRNKQGDIIFCPKCQCSGFIESTLNENRYICTNSEEHSPKKDYLFTLLSPEPGNLRQKRPKTKA